MSAKPVLSYFAEKIPTLPDATAKDVCEFALLRIQARIVSFEEQVCVGQSNQLSIKYQYWGTLSKHHTSTEN